MGAETLMPYLAKYFVTTMTVRGESINIPCLLRGMLKPRFWTGKPIIAYTEAYIQVVLPKVVITFIDNNSGFYEISKSFPDIKTIFIQNGMRSMEAFYGIVKSNNYHVDYMLVHGSAIGKYYHNYREWWHRETGSQGSSRPPVTYALSCFQLVSECR